MAQLLAALVPRAGSLAPAALQAAGGALGSCAGRLGYRGIHSTASAAKVERGPQQSASRENVKQPFNEGDELAAAREIWDSYRDVLKDSSGTAEDVGVLDQKQSSLGRMMADPRGVEQEYADKAMDTVASHGGRERESEDQGIADAVFDQRRSDSGYDPTGDSGKRFEDKYSQEPGGNKEPKS